MIFNCHKVYQCLSTKFGAIRIATLIPGFAFILFDDDKVGVDMLSKHRIEIKNDDIELKRADYNNLPYEMYKVVRKSMTAPRPIVINQLLLQPEVQESPKNILNSLNDHCLREIMVRLSFFDICNVSKTCETLNQIAEEVVASKYKEHAIPLRDDRISNKKTMTHSILVK